MHQLPPTTLATLPASALASDGAAVRFGRLAPPAAMRFKATLVFQQLTFWRVVLFCLATLQPGLTHAQSGEMAIGVEDSYLISSAFTYLEDPEQTLALDDVLRPDMQNRFQPTGRTTTNFGYTKSAIWLRVVLKVDRDAPSAWFLEVSNPTLDQLDIYVSNTSGGFDHQRGAGLVPFSERTVLHRNHVKPIVLQPSGDTILYMRVASRFTVSPLTRLWQPAAIWNHDQRDYAELSLYFGLLLGLLLYNLLLYFSIGDRAYLSYVAFTFAMGVIQASVTGLGTQFIWTDFPELSVVSLQSSRALLSFFAILFTRDFLATATRMPKFDVVLRVLAGGWLAAFVAGLLSDSRMFNLMGAALSLLSVVVVIGVGLWGVRKRYPEAKYFLIAWASLSIGIVIYAMHNLGFLPSNLFTANSLRIGSAFEMILLSFALADRINIARRDKELAQAKVISEQATTQVLRRSQERYLAVIESVGEGMAVERDGRIVFVNARAAEIAGRSKQDLIENGILDFVHPDDRSVFAKLLQDAAMTGAKKGRHEIRLVLSDGTERWIELGTSSVPWEGTHDALIFFSDQTDRKRAEDETRVALDKQKDLNDLRSRFVAMTSHEFRTPLAAILSSQELLLHYSDRLPETEKHTLLVSISDGVNRMARMLDRVLLLSRADAKMAEFRPLPMNLRTLCDTLVAETQTQQPNTRCHIVTDFAPEIETGRFDEQLLRHILGNLLSNAVKYSPQGGEVKFTAKADNGFTVLEVSDQGIGIPANEIDHLFERFHRASNVGDIQGTGLGLAIVKSSVDLHGGSILVSSTIGSGTCFSVRLPILTSS